MNVSCVERTLDGAASSTGSGGSSSLAPGRCVPRDHAGDHRDDEDDGRRMPLRREERGLAEAAEAPADPNTASR